MSDDMKENTMYQTVFWVGHINSIGGVETFLLEIAKRYGDRDITVLYRTGDRKQIQRLRQYVRTLCWDGKPFECVTLICNYDTGICDFVSDQYIAVSKTAAEGWKEVTGISAEVCYNPITVEKPKKVLRLISCTRLTPEKGGKRMEILARRLTDAGIPFLWTIFTNSAPIFHNPNVIFLPPKLEGVRDMIADSDYLVQLSDTEACCYSMMEALSLGVPLIVTPFQAAYELGAEDGKNAYFLPFDMSEIPAKDIYNNIPKFTYQALEDHWDDFITKSKSTYKEEKDMQYKVRATDEWEKRGISDAVLGHIPKPGEKYEIDEDRLDLLTGNNEYNAVFVEVVEKKQPKPKAPATKGRKKKE